MNFFDLLKTNCWRHSNLSTFRLRTLYCDAFLALSRIIKPNCRYFNTQAFRRYSQVLGKVPIYASQWSSLFTTFFNKIPAFNSIDRCSLIFQVLAESFLVNLRERSCSTTLAGSPSISSRLLAIYMDLQRTWWLRGFLGSSGLTFCFENPCIKIVSLLLTTMIVI